MSVPPMSTAPSVTSIRRGSSATKVVLPEPVDPTTAVVVPGAVRKLMSRNTDSSAPGYLKHAERNSTMPAEVRSGFGSVGGTTDVSVSRTS